MKLLTTSILVVLSLNSCAQQEKKTVNTSQKISSTKIIGGGCECCEGIYQGMPQELDYETTIQRKSEPGEQLEIRGKIFQSDGKTPAQNVILYVYHTNAKGYYEPEKEQTGCAGRHGHLRNWIKTNAKGEYKFKTIRPAPYPNGIEPAHIHPVIKEEGKNEYYIDAFIFDDDILLTNEFRKRYENRGGSGIVKLSKDASDAWKGYRDIILGKNVPDYY